MKRFAARLLLAMTAVVLVLGFSVYVLFRASLPQLDGAVQVAGLKDRVVIERDALGVPTVKAGNREDLARATGFLHAQERFFQMDLYRRDAAGELAALVGAIAVERDKKRRLHRLRAVALSILEAAATGDRAFLKAYADGVNAGLGALDQPPFEYLLLNVAPEIWQPEDTLLAVFAMYFELHDEEASRESMLGVMHEVLPEALYEFLVQDGTEWDAPLVGDAVAPAPLPDASVYDLRELRNIEFGLPDLQAAAVSREAPLPGSNNWAVASDYTAYGRALLANDMHLGLILPNTWYRMRLVLQHKRESFDITGVTLPGVPLIAAGSNRNVAWGFTNSYGDWADLVTLKLHPQNPELYLTPDGYKPFTMQRETIAVRDGEPVILEIRETIWGPVLGADYQGRLRALKWLAHTPNAINLGLLALERVQTAEEALRVAATVGMPPQNFVVADNAGNIGWTIIGPIPVRAGIDPQLPGDWSAGAGWHGWLAPEDYPRLLNPPAGRIWTANARVANGPAQSLIGNGGYALGARQQQIRDRLLATDNATLHDMLALQLDDRALLLERWRDLLLETLTPETLQDHPRRAELRDVVANAWTGRASVDSAAYRLVRAWRDILHDAIFAALTAECRVADPDFRFGRVHQSERPLWQLVTERPPHLLNPDYASWEAQLLAAVDQTLDYFARFEGPLAERTWGERNTVRVQHPLSAAIPFSGYWLNMPRRALPGDMDMPRVQSVSFGASERFAVSPGREDEGYFHMPGGQSGHPLSPYYDAGHEAWVRGRRLPFLPGQAAHLLVLIPK